MRELLTFGLPGHRLRPSACTGPRQTRRVRHAGAIDTKGWRDFPGDVLEERTLRGVVASRGREEHRMKHYTHLPLDLARVDLCISDLVKHAADADDQLHTKSGETNDHVIG